MSNPILEIGNSYSRLTGLTPKQEKAVRKSLTYMLDASAAYFSGGFRSRQRCLMDKRGNFPTGLLKRLPFNDLTPYAIVDKRKRPARSSTKDLIGLFDWQIDATEAALLRHRGIISAPTGSGKTMAMKNLVQKLNAKTLIVVPTLELKKQVEGQFSDLKLVTVENIDSANLKKLKDFDCLIIDEAHHVAAKTYQKLNKTVWTNIYYRFFFTATPFRNNKDEEMLFEAIAGQLIYQLTYHQAVADNVIVPVEGYYFEIPKQKTEAYSYSEVYSELVVNNKLRNMLIADLLKICYQAERRTLCLVREVAHGALLMKLTGFPFVSGADEDSRKYIEAFNRGERTILIGTTGILGEGVDTKCAEYVIIAGLGKAKSQFMQQVGRVLRKFEGKDSGKAILIKDRSHRFLSRHFKAQCDIMKDEYGIVPIKLEV